MDRQSNPILIYVVEDDEEDKYILSSELKVYGQEFEVHFFPDVKHLINVFNTKSSSLPSLILIPAFHKAIDIEQAVAIFKYMPVLNTIPIVVMLGAQGEKEYFRLSGLDVSGFVCGGSIKLDTFSGSLRGYPLPALPVKPLRTQPG
jgi:CheY-like chemotaxis protein